MPKVQREVSMPLDGHTFFLYNQLQNHVQQQKHNVLYTHNTTYNLKYYKFTNVLHAVAQRHNVYPVCRMATPDPSAISSVCHSAVTPSPLPSHLDGWLRMARMKVKVNLTIIKVMLIPFSVCASIQCALCSDIKKIMAQESPRITNTVSFTTHCTALHFILGHKEHISDFREDKEICQGSQFVHFPHWQIPPLVGKQPFQRPTRLLVP